MINEERNASQTFKDFNTGQLLNLLDNNNKDSIRKLKKRNKNLVNTKYGILFNNNIYIYIYILYHVLWK